MAALGRVQRDIKNNWLEKLRCLHGARPITIRMRQHETGGNRIDSMNKQPDIDQAVAFSTVQLRVSFVLIICVFIRRSKIVFNLTLHSPLFAGHSVYSLSR